MPRAGTRDIAKEKHWRQIVADQQASGLGVVTYCHQKGIKVNQFYYWQTKFAENDAKPPASNRQHMAARAKRIAQSARREKSRSVEFAEVQIVDRAQIEAEKPIVDTGTLEVVFPTGTKVRITAGCSLELFASVVNLLENR